MSPPNGTAKSFGVTHRRLECKTPVASLTSVIHALVPEQIRGVKVYVHGYDVDYSSPNGRPVGQPYLDWAMLRHNLLPQFQQAAEAGYLCLFVSGPTKRQFPVLWPSFDAVRHALLTSWIWSSGEFTEALAVAPLQVYGHSAAYRTLVNWLKDPLLVSVTLLDGLYGYVQEFKDWFEQTQPVTDIQRKLALVNTHSGRPRDNSQLFMAHVREPASTFSVNTIDAAPIDIGERRLLVGTVKCSHMQLVTGGKVLPWLMARGF